MPAQGIPAVPPDRSLDRVKLKKDLADPSDQQRNRPFNRPLEGPQELGAERAIDATGLVVAPGFIDLHAHGQSIPADRMQAFDGVTTTLDLEAGVLPVASWYRRQAAQGRVLNYGAAANWAFARIGAMTCDVLGPAAATGTTRLSVADGIVRARIRRA